MAKEHKKEEHKKAEHHHKKEEHGKTALKAKMASHIHSKKK